MSIENKVPMSNFTEVTDISDTARIIGLQDNDNVKFPIQSVIAKALEIINERVLLQSDINKPNGVTGFEPIGKVDIGNLQAVSGDEVSNSIIRPLNNIGLKFESIDLFLKDKSKYLADTSILTDGTTRNTTGFSTTSGFNDLLSGEYTTNLGLTSLVAFITYNSEYEIVNVYSNKTGVWEFSVNEDEKFYKYCVRDRDFDITYINSVSKEINDSEFIEKISSEFIPVSEKDNLGVSTGVYKFNTDTNIFKYSNFNDPTKFVPNGLINSSGNVVLGNNWRYFHFPIKQGIHLTNLYLTASVNLVTFDSNGNIVQVLNNKGTSNGLTQWSFNTTENEKYIISCVNNSQMNKELENALYITAGSNYELATNDVFKLQSQSFDTDFQDVCLGDSVTQYGDYPLYISQNIGINAINLGTGGSSLSALGNSDITALSASNWATAINTGDFTNINTALDNLIANTTGQTSQRHQRTKRNLESINWDKVRRISFFYGTNDFSSSRALGDKDLDNMDITTISGAINHIVNMVNSKYPHIQILFVTPTHRFMTSDFVQAQDSDYYKNTAQLKLIDYVDTIKEMANMNHITCLDMYRNSGFNRQNHAYYFTDGVHPNKLGFEKIATLIGNKIKSMM